MSVNRKSLKSNVMLLVDGISFAPVSGTDWAVNDKVVFAGTLEEVLVFALKNFSVFTTIIQEVYSLIWERNMQSLEAYPITPITLLGAVHVTPAEVDLVGSLTNNYRLGLSDGAGVVMELKSDPTTKLFYRGSRGAILAYLLQMQDAGTDRIYELYNFSLLDSSKMESMGISFDDILGVNGPVELEKAHPTLANAIAGANVIR